MGIRQGRKRLEQGITRKLTRHEIARGYVYVSQDRDLSDVLDVNNFTVIFDDTVVSNRRIDVSGRVHISRRLLTKVGLGRPITIRLTSKKYLEIETAK